MQCIFRANKMADARITNVDTGDSTDVRRLSSRRAKLNTYLAQSVSRPCKCMQLLFKSLIVRLMDFKQGLDRTKNTPIVIRLNCVSN